MPACLLLSSAKPAPPARPVVEIRMAASADGRQVAFDPIGIRIQPGQTVRWVQISNYHSTTAYHPANSNHQRRIPVAAAAWDSGVLIGQYPGKGATFEHTFTIEGVYDYFCRPHEQAGMVGRIVVGHPLPGPGTGPFAAASAAQWQPVPKAAQQAFPAIREIMAKGIVRSHFR